MTRPVCRCKQKRSLRERRTLRRSTRSRTRPQSGTRLISRNGTIRLKRTFWRPATKSISMCRNCRKAPTAVLSNPTCQSDHVYGNSRYRKPTSTLCLRIHPRHWSFSRAFRNRSRRLICRLQRSRNNAKGFSMLRSGIPSWRMG